ncbi:MAG: FCD domain-containing protein, partial [Verrucomicrobiota bacterium]
TDGEHVALDRAFHLAIAEASGNAMFMRLLEVLSGFLAHVQTESCRDDAARRAAASREHFRISEAIAQGDPDAARLEMQHHLRLSEEALIEKLNREKG